MRVTASFPLGLGEHRPVFNSAAQTVKERAQFRTRVVDIFVGRPIAGQQPVLDGINDLAGRAAAQATALQEDILGLQEVGERDLLLTVARAQELPNREEHHDEQDPEEQRLVRLLHFC